ncbi:MAG: glycosyltransferase family 39 protein [Verrucomicrobiota bacterium]|nr:glycosyltransferase family 39 protein [Verrucomicrobiota bacterium]
MNPPLQPAIRNFALIFFASLLFHLPGTWTLPLIDRDEPRFAEASREMLERSDYVVPFFNNNYRFDKPPLTYWFQTLSYRVFGINDFAARFPSAVAAALTAVLLFAWGRRIGPECVAWWAVIIFTVSFQTCVHAKAAVADMWLVLFVTAAHWAGYELLRDRFGPHPATHPIAPGPQPRWWWMFYLALACAFLAKGPIGWTPLLAVGVTKWFVPDAQLQRRFLFATGIIFMLSVVAIWGVPAVLRTDWEFLRVGLGRHVVSRSFGTFHGHGARSAWMYFGTLPFYFVTIFLTFLPWSVKLPWLARKLWRERDRLDAYLIGGAAVIFLVFTLVTTKLPHYTLPAFPLLALLLAKALVATPGAERFVRRAAIIGLAVALLVSVATPLVSRFFISEQLARKAGADVTPEMEFAEFEYSEPSLVWYFRKHTKRWLADLQEFEVPLFMNRPGPRFIVLQTARVPALFPTIPSGWKTYSVRGINPTIAKPLDVTLLLKPF